MMNKAALARLYNQLSGGLTLYDASKAFVELDIMKIDTHNQFFESYGVGNTLDGVNLPRERFLCYEGLLKELQNIDWDRFLKIHKGTAYYFLSFLAFDSNHPEKAMLYLDYAISEDIRANAGSILKTPAVNLVLLESGGAADRVTSLIKGLFTELISYYNSNLKRNYSVDIFVGKFISEIIKKPENRSLITAIYSHVLTFQQLGSDITIRPHENVSIEPWVLHLVKGGLIFESLAKLKYPTKDDGSRIQTLGGLKENSAFIQKYFAGRQSDFATSSKDFQSILNDIDLKDEKNAFCIITKLRNLSGHNLIQDDVFNDVTNYSKLFEQSMAAILFFIENEYQ